MMNPAICVQAFNKADTIVQTLQSLAQANRASDFDLIIFQDGLEGNRFEQRYQLEHMNTMKAIEMWLSENPDAFKSAIFRPQVAGRGTAGTAKVLIDYGFVDHDWIIFSEDDVVYERDALEWFMDMISHEGFLREEVWAIAGEAKHFDSKGGMVAEEAIKMAHQEAIELSLISKYCYFDWLPSSCFATNRRKWQEFGETRGLPRGPKMVNDRCKTENKRSLWPVIARCQDIGMHHEVGYSISIHKVADKVPQKSNFLVSGALKREASQFSEFKDLTRIYQRFTTSFAKSN